MEDLDVRFMNKIQQVAEMEKSFRKVNETMDELSAKIVKNTENQLSQNKLFKIKIDEN